MAESAVQVEGLEALRRAFRAANTGIDRDLRAALESAAEPVRSDASELALTRISGMARSSLPWWDWRTGVTRSTAYIAPRMRGDKSRRATRRRPNLKQLLLDRAATPALERNILNAEREVIDALNDLARMWSRVP